MQSDETPRPQILAFGDSLTAGYGLPAAQSFPAQLQALLRERHPAALVHNAGVSGDTSANGRARLARVLSRLPARPDLAIVDWAPTICSAASRRSGCATISTGSWASWAAAACRCCSPA